MTATTRHDLFAVDPAEFVATRDELVRELKAAGERDEAAAVKALRRPPVPVWALNRIAHDNRDAIEALLAATAEAQGAQDALLAGDADGDALRGALAQRRTALQAVVRGAIDVIESSGRAAGTQQRDVESLLTAAVASDELRELLRKGELVELPDDQEGDDLASLLSASVTEGATTKPRPVSNLADARAAKEAAAARKEEERRKAAAEAAAALVRKAQEAAANADRELAQAQEALLRAQEKAADAHAALQRAEDAARTRS